MHLVTAELRLQRYFSPDLAEAAAGQPFIRHSISKDVWRSATRSAAGSTLSVEIVLAAGGKAYGPLKQTYKIALAPFNGRIYYQAYATIFATNSSGGDHVQWDPNTRFGAATLSIDVGAESPKLVAGTDTPDNTGCRVCHSVSAYGDRMIVQHGDVYTQSSSYDLKNNNTQSTPYAEGLAGWAGMTPDGNLALANSVDVTGTGSVRGDTKLFNAVTGADVPSQGLTNFAKRTSASGVLAGQQARGVRLGRRRQHTGHRSTEPPARLDD